ncbi:MAG: hypothetical protein HOE90_23195 [Bacteriovoracaceae bacterium]|nr:hypothetical protein [Bacteriovoracaceae bacterium]
MYKTIASIIFVSLICASSFAAKKSDKFSLPLNLDFSTSLYNDEDTTRYYTGELEITPTYNFYREHLIGFDFSAYRETSKFEKNKIGSETLFYSKGFKSFSNENKLTKSLKYGLKVSATLPFGRDSYNIGSEYTTLSASPRLMLDFTEYGAKGLALRYYPSISKSIHQYETSSTGTSNTSYAISNSFIISYNFLEKLSFSASYTHIMPWSYNSKKDTSYHISQQLSLSLTNQIDIYVGHSNSQSMTGPDGQTLDINAIDNSTSMINSGISFTF